LRISSTKTSAIPRYYDTIAALWCANCLWAIWKRAACISCYYAIGALDARPKKKIAQSHLGSVFLIWPRKEVKKKREREFRYVVRRQVALVENPCRLVPAATAVDTGKHTVQTKAMNAAMIMVVIVAGTMRVVVAINVNLRRRVGRVVCRTLHF